MIRAFRPLNLFIIALICLTFEVLSHRLNGTSISLSLDFFAFTFGAVSVAAAGYLINGYFDQKIDQLNIPGYQYPFSKLTTYVICLSLVIEALVIGLSFYSLKFTLGFVLMPAIALWLYSAILKKLPFIGNLAVSFLSFWLPTGLLLVNNSLSQLKTSGFVSQFTMLLLVEMFVISLAREVVKDIQDIDGDRAVNCKTIPIVFNEKVAGILTTLLLTIGALMWFNVLKKNIDYITVSSVIAGIITLGFVIASILLLWLKKTWKDRTKLSSLTIKLSMLFALLTALFI